jgi:hypothetical protein
MRTALRDFLLAAHGLGLSACSSINQEALTPAGRFRNPPVFFEQLQSGEAIGQRLYGKIYVWDEKPTSGGYHSCGLTPFFNPLGRVFRITSDELLMRERDGNTMVIPFDNPMVIADQRFNWYWLESTKKR